MLILEFGITVKLKHALISEDASIIEVRLLSGVYGNIIGMRVGHNLLVLTHEFS